MHLVAVGQFGILQRVSSVPRLLQVGVCEGVPVCDQDTLGLQVG